MIGETLYYHPTGQTLDSLKEALDKCKNRKPAGHSKVKIEKITLNEIKADELQQFLESTLKGEYTKEYLRKEYNKFIPGVFSIAGTKCWARIQLEFMNL